MAYCLFKQILTFTSGTEVRIFISSLALRPMQPKLNPIAQWSLYVPPVYHSEIPRSANTAVFTCFVTISEQTAIISLYRINWLVCISETECVYCAVRTGYLYLILRSAHTAVFMCFVWIWEQTAIISLYRINWLVCITKTECVYCAVRTGFLNINEINFYL